MKIIFKNTTNIYKRSTNVSINDYIYILALILYITHNFIATSTITILKSIFIGKIINPIIIFLLFISMIDKKIATKNKKIIILLSFLIVVVIGKNSLQNKIPILFDFLFIIAIYKKNLNVIIKSLFYTYASLLIMAFSFSKMNLIENIIVYRDNGYGELRYALGMIHPNTFYIYYFVCISSFIYIQKNMTLFKRVIILLLSYYIYILTDARAGFIMITLLIVIDYILGKVKIELGSMLAGILVNIFSIFTIVSYLMTIFFDNSKLIFRIIDSILSHRITLMKKFYDIYGINLWGNIVKYKAINNGIVSNQDMVLDNTYMYLLIDMGVIFTIIICLLFSKLLKKLIKMKLNKELAIIVIYIIFALSERLTLLQYNFSILFFFYLINFSSKKFKYKIKI